MSSKLDKFLTIKPIWYKDRDKAQELQELEKAEKELEEKYFSIRTEESKCNPLGCTIKKVLICNSKDRQAKNMLLIRTQKLKMQIKSKSSIYETIHQ